MILIRLIKDHGKIFSQFLTCSYVPDYTVVIGCVILVAVYALSIVEHMELGFF